MGLVSKRKNDYIQRTYLNLGTGASYTSPYKLFKYIEKHGKFKVTLKEVKSALNDIKTYIEFKKANKKPSKFPISICPRKGYMLQLDTAYVPKLATYNKNFAYFLLGIECLTRKVFTWPLKDITGKTVSAILDAHFRTHKYELVYTDAGTELVNAQVKEIYSKYGIKHIISRSGTKAFLSEKAIFSIKSKIYKFLDHTKSQVWYKHLKDATRSYNQTPHKSLGWLSPDEASKLSNYKLFEIMYEKKDKNKKPKKLKFRPKVNSPYSVKIGDFVKILKIKGTFDKYKKNFSSEVFQVASRYLKSRIPVFILKDSSNSLIDGIFYQNEIAKVKNAEKFQIEKIIKKQKFGEHDYCLIHWKNTNSNQDTFIPCSEVATYKA